MLQGIISKLYKIQGINIIKPITIGKNIVQQMDIKRSKRILGKEALAQIKKKIIIKVFIPILKTYNIPWTIGSNI